MKGSRPGSRQFLMGMGMWFILACVLGSSGRLARITPPLPQVLIGAITLVLIMSAVFNRALRVWLEQVNLRGFVAFHLTRFVGIVFLVMYSRGQLGGEFALTAGWGDIIAAVGALGIALLLPDPLQQPRVLFLWNAFGLADILTVVVTATRVALRSPADIASLLQFPMSLVPTFVVPIVIASHVLVFWRLRRAGTPS